MIFEVKQTRAAGGNEFDIVCGDKALYRGTASWFPLGLDKTNKVTLCDPDGRLLYETKYHLMDNLIEASLPFKNLTKEGQKFDRYQVLDAAGNVVGAFYDLRRVCLDNRMCIAVGDKLYNAFRREMGFYEAASFYDGETQFAQLTRTGVVVDNLDHYYFHLLPAYESLLPLMALYAVYYDFIHHNNSGQYFKGKSVNMSYSYDIHQKKYNANFIRDNFGEEENQRLEAFAKRNVDSRKFWLFFAGVWILVLSMIAGIWLLLAHLNHLI